MYAALLTVVTAFLNGKMPGENNVYIELPDGYSIEGKVGLLKKGLYGLK